MALKAVQAFRKMPGSTQSQLMLCSDANLWVVKCRNNPQGPHVLAKELITANIAQSIGLSVPRSDIVEIGDDLIANTDEILVKKSHGLHESCVPSPGFGSQFAGGLMPGRVVDWLPALALREVVNLSEFAGALVLDIWTRNTDFRQAVFRKAGRGQKHQAFFIDHGHCLNLGKWRTSETPLLGLYRQPEVYENVRNLDSFQPWLDRVRLFDTDLLWKHIARVPEEWDFGSREDLEILTQELMRRGRCIDGLVSDFLAVRRGLFRDCLHPIKRNTRPRN
jgi:hypothetical protein